MGRCAGACVTNFHSTELIYAVADSVDVSIEIFAFLAPSRQLFKAEVTVFVGSAQECSRGGSFPSVWWCAGNTVHAACGSLVAPPFHNRREVVMCHGRMCCMCVTPRKQQRPGIATNSNDLSHGTHKSTKNPTMHCHYQRAHEQHFNPRTCHLTNHTATSTPSLWTHKTQLTVTVSRSRPILFTGQHKATTKAPQLLVDIDGQHTPM